MKIGIDTYSFHRFFGETTKWEVASEEQWTVTEFLQFADTNYVKVVTLETCYLKPKDPALQKELSQWLAKDPTREIAFTWGHPNGFDGGKKPEALESVLDFLSLSHSLGLEQMRIVLGNHWNFATPPEERFPLLTPLITKILEVATLYNMRIAVENHADFPVRTLMKFIESFNSPRLGMCFDFGNSIRVGDDPVHVLQDVDINKIFMVQVKDVRKMPGHEEPTGWWPTVLYGTGDANPGKCLQILKANGFADPIVVELSNVFTGLTEKEVAVQAIGFLRKELVG